MLARVSKVAAAGFSQTSFEIFRRKTKQRHDTKHYCNQDREAQRKTDRPRVDANLIYARQALLIQTEQQVDSPKREQHAEPTCDKHQQQILRDELPRQTPASCSQRGAHGKL